jgi:hypothetical protein
MNVSAKWWTVLGRLTVSRERPLSPPVPLGTVGRYCRVASCGQPGATLGDCSSARRVTWSLARTVGVGLAGAV